MARTSLKNISLLIMRDEHNLKFTVDRLKNGNLTPIQKKSFTRQLQTISNRLKDYRGKYMSLYEGDTITTVIYTNDLSLNNIANRKYFKIRYVGVQEREELELLVERDQKKYGIYYLDSHIVTTGKLENLEEIPNLEK